jgi:hypothetical protein
MCWIEVQRVTKPILNAQENTKCDPWLELIANSLLKTKVGNLNKILYLNQ